MAFGLEGFMHSLLIDFKNETDNVRRISKAKGS
jgi:hypothetical protein